jgi:hypothetical protein
MCLSSEMTTVLGPTADIFAPASTFRGVKKWINLGTFYPWAKNYEGEESACEGVHF